jgi:hypothetical protein
MVAKGETMQVETDFETRKRRMEEFNTRREARKKREEQVEKLGHDIIKEGYRSIAKTFHPDAGGTVEQFQLLKDARDELIEELAWITEFSRRRRNKW